MNIVKCIGTILSLVAVNVSSATTPCGVRARGATFAHYAPSFSYVAPLVTYYPPAAPVAYSASYGLSSEGLEIVKMLLERDAAREAKYEAILQKMIENGGPIPAKTPAKHPGLAVLTNRCAECHGEASGKKGGGFVFLKGGMFVDDEKGENLAKVLDALDPFGPKAKDGRSYMPPKSHEPVPDREAMAVNSFLNRLPPPDTAKLPK